MLSPSRRVIPGSTRGSRVSITTHRDYGFRVGRFAAPGNDGLLLARSKPHVGSAWCEAFGGGFFSAALEETDAEIAGAIGKELGRQRDEIELIASENIVSRAVLEAQGSVLTNNMPKDCRASAIMAAASTSMWSSGSRSSA